MDDIDPEIWAKAEALSDQAKMMGHVISHLSVVSRMSVILGMLCDCLADIPAESRQEVLDLFTFRLRVFIGEIANRGV